MGVMNSVSKPLLGVLLAAVALFASVFVFFKGHSASTGGTPNAPVYQSAINQAKHAVKTSDAANGELAAAATHSVVVKVAVPVSAISSFTMLTNTVPVSTSPTLILIDRDGNASTITGFADRFEIAQRLNALAK